MTVIDEIAAERRRQIEVEGWTAEHDDAHESGTLLAAATIYFLHAKYGVFAATGLAHGINIRTDGAPEGWPWEPQWWKPKTPRQDLIRGGALCLAEREHHNRSTGRDASTPYPPAEQKLDLIIAEIERLDRANARAIEKGA